MKKLLTILTLSLLALNAFGQRTVRGTVVDYIGDPAIGATIRVKGTTFGTIADVNGNFTLTVPDGDVVLEISLFGLDSRLVKISSSGEVRKSAIVYRPPPPRVITNIIGINYDIANSLYGVSFTQSFRGRFGYGLLAQSNFSNDYVLGGSVGINSPFQHSWHFWRIHRLSLNYMYKNLSDNIEFNFQRISIKGYTSLRHRHKRLHMTSRNLYRARQAKAASK